MFSPESSEWKLFLRMDALEGAEIPAQKAPREFVDPGVPVRQEIVHTTAKLTYESGDQRKMRPQNRNWKEDFHLLQILVAFL